MKKKEKPGCPISKKESKKHAARKMKKDPKGLGNKVTKPGKKLHQSAEKLIKGRRGNGGHQRRKEGGRKEKPQRWLSVRTTGRVKLTGIEGYPEGKWISTRVGRN